MKKIIIENTKKKKIVATLCDNLGDSIVVLVHGFLSSRKAFDNTANILQKEGYSTIAFDFTGCGESEDELVDYSTKSDDLRSIIEYVEKHYKKIILFGYSLGALISFFNYKENIRGIIGLGAVTGSFEVDFDRYVRVLAKHKDKDYIECAVNHEGRDSIKIKRSMIEQFKGLNQRDIFTKIKCPVFLMNGEVELEAKLLQTSKNALQYIKNVKLEIIPNGIHDYRINESEYLKSAVNWMKKQHL